MTSLRKYKHICTLTWKARFMFDLWIFQSSIFSQPSRICFIFQWQKINSQEAFYVIKLFLQDQNLLFYGEFNDSTVLFFCGIFFSIRDVVFQVYEFSAKILLPLLLCSLSTLCLDSNLQQRDGGISRMGRVTLLWILFVNCSGMVGTI